MARPDRAAGDRKVRRQVEGRPAPADDLLGIGAAPVYSVARDAERAAGVRIASARPLTT